MAVTYKDQLQKERLYEFNENAMMSALEKGTAYLQIRAYAQDDWRWTLYANRWEAVKGLMKDILGWG